MLAVVEDFGVVAGYVPLRRDLPVTEAIVLTLLWLVVLDHATSLGVERELGSAYLLVFMVLGHIVNIEYLLPQVIGAR